MTHPCHCRWRQGETVSEEDGAVYGRLQDAWVEMCSTYLEMVGDLGSCGKEGKIGEEWEGEESLVGIIGELNDNQGDKSKNASKGSEERRTKTEHHGGEEGDFSRNTSKESEELSTEKEQQKNSHEEETHHDKMVKENKEETTVQEYRNWAEDKDSADVESRKEPEMSDSVEHETVPDNEEDPINGNEKPCNMTGAGAEESGMGNSSSANNSMDQPIVEEEAVDVMSENKNASASTLETEGNADPEETVHNNTESPPESDQNGAQDFDVPNKEENSFKEEEEHIIESESGNCVQTKSDAEAAPFSFSDFARQPNRPDSPNLSEVSDPPEGENQEGKKSEESQKQLAQNGSPVMVEVRIEEIFKQLAITL